MQPLYWLGRSGPRPSGDRVIYSPTSRRVSTYGRSWGSTEVLDPIRDLPVMTPLLKLPPLAEIHRPIPWALFRNASKRSLKGPPMRGTLCPTLRMMARSVFSSWWSTSQIASKAGS